MASLMRNTGRTGRTFRLSVLVAGLLVLSIPAAAVTGPQYLGMPPYETPNLTPINMSPPNGTHPFTFTPTLKPITLLHLELNETTPTGVRYMAFEPKVIDISVSPVFLAILAGLIGIAAGGGYMFRKRGNGN
jgi:hypothetical protein